MKFFCDQCEAQYFIADEKVGDKGVKVRCKRCENVIVIRPPVTSPDPSSLDALDDDRAAAATEMHQGSDEETVFPTDDLGDGLSEAVTDPAAISLGKKDGPDDAPAADEALADDDDDPMLAPLDDDEAEGLGSLSETLTADTAIAPSPYLGDPDAAEAVAAAADSEDDLDEGIRATQALAAEGDLLDNELAGAFDNVFSGIAAQEDPFAEVGGVEDTDHSRRETKFYSQNEMATVEAERDADPQSPDETHPEEEPDLGDSGGNGIAATPFGRLVEEAADDTLAAPQSTSEGGEHEALWYAAVDDEQVGPLSEIDLSDNWRRGEIDADTLIWQSGMGDWMPMGEVETLSALVQELSRHSRPPQTEVEQPGALAASALSGADSLDDEASSNLGSSPFDAGDDDPFAMAEDAPAVMGAGSTGNWRPHGMTEIYQAASLAEQSAMQALPSPEDEIGDDGGEVDWQPGAAAALASLVEEEIESIEHTPGVGSAFPSADDVDLHSDGALSVKDDLLGAAPLALPAGLDEPVNDPFAQQLSGHTSDDINIEQIAGQSSMVLQRPSMTPRARREIPWALILGAGGGGLALIGLFVVVIILLLRDPKPAVVAQTTVPNQGQARRPDTAPAPPVTPVKPAVAPAQPAANPSKPVQEAAKTTTVALAQPTDAKPEKNRAGSVSRRNDRRNKRRSSHRNTRTAAPRPEPKPVVKDPPKKKRRSGNCDPILYPDGNCPTGAAALPPSRSKKGVKSKLSKIDILMTVKKNMKSVRSCTSEQRKRSPRMATGTIKMQWYIRTDGRTKNVAVLTSKFKGSYIGGCMQKAVKKWRFPAFSGDDVGPIKFPFPLD